VHNRETKAELSANGSSITVSHEGESASIRLPTRIQGGGDAGLYLPAEPPSKELTLRLRLEEKDGQRLLRGPDEREGNWVPWGASQLNEMAEVGLVCRECEGDLVGSGKVKEWKDLPNENWAEMMDFWHCHKPSEHDHHGHAHGEDIGKTKGYAASNRLRAVQGTGFVDLGAFLVKEEDCKNIKVVVEKGSQSRNLVCGSCNGEVGIIDDRAEGWRVWKWSVAISSSKKLETYSVQKWISAHFLALIENQGVRKFNVRAEGGDGSSLMLWIFTPDLSFSSSVVREGRKDPTRAMKVFWQPAASFEDSSEKQSFSVEEMAFPARVYQALRVALRESAELLPTSARKFQGWNVSLLERFELANT